MVVRAHGARWKEKGLLTSNNKDIKHASEILTLIKAVTDPEATAITPCLGHQKLTSFGNSLAVQGLGLCVLTAKGLDLIPGWGTKILQAAQRGQNQSINQSINLLHRSRQSGCC